MLDGLASHFSPSVIKLAKERHVILYVLSVHTSHVIQPLDVSIFGPFKTFYYQESASFMQRNKKTAKVKMNSLKLKFCS
jgi:hypothetical protein